MITKLLMNFVPYWTIWSIKSCAIQMLNKWLIKFKTSPYFIQSKYKLIFLEYINKSMLPPYLNFQPFFFLLVRLPHSSSKKKSGNVHYKLEFTVFQNVLWLLLSLTVLHCRYKSTVAKLTALRITSYGSVNYLPLGFIMCSINQKIFICLYKC